MTDPDLKVISDEQLAADAFATLERAALALSQIDWPDTANPYEALQRIAAQQRQGIGEMLIALGAFTANNGRKLARLVELAEADDRRVRSVERPDEAPRHTSDELLTVLQRASRRVADDAGIFIDVQGGKVTVTQTLDFDVPIAVNGEWLGGVSRHRYTVEVTPG